jgi:hypothetical protein
MANRVNEGWQLSWDGNQWSVGNYDSMRGMYVYAPLDDSHTFIQEVDAWRSITLEVVSSAERMVEILVDGGEPKRLQRSGAGWTRTASATSNAWNITGRYVDDRGGVIPNIRLTRGHDDELPDPQFKVILRGG